MSAGRKVADKKHGFGRKVFVGLGIALLVVLVVAFFAKPTTQLPTTVVKKPVPHESHDGKQFDVFTPKNAPAYQGDMTVLVNGSLGTGIHNATVLTDRNCAPDSNGISHCLNDVRLHDGTEITVQHHHKLSEVPCLTPNQEVVINMIV